MYVFLIAPVSNLCYVTQFLYRTVFANSLAFSTFLRLDAHVGPCDHPPNPSLYALHRRDQSESQIVIFRSYAGEVGPIKTLIFEKV